MQSLETLLQCFCKKAVVEAPARRGSGKKADLGSQRQRWVPVTQNKRPWRVAGEEGHSLLHPSCSRKGPPACTGELASAEHGRGHNHTMETSPPNHLPACPLKTELSLTGHSLQEALKKVRFAKTWEDYVYQA